jgi:hypothetical protein
LIRGDIDTPVRFPAGAARSFITPRRAVPPTHTRWLLHTARPQSISHLPTTAPPRLDKARRWPGKMTRDVEMAAARYAGEGGVAYPPRHDGGVELDGDGKKKRTGKQIKSAARD